MTAAPREPSRLPVRGTIGLVGTVGALALLLSLRGGPAPVGEVVVAIDDEAEATDELMADTATEAPTVEPGDAPAPEPSTEPATELVEAEPITVTGDAFTIRWGNVQVAVTLDGTDIVDVATLSIPASDRRSQRINEFAEPVLREEAIAIDSADVSVVSGATFTSEAYAASLQSALDQLGM